MEHQVVNKLIDEIADKDRAISDIRAFVCENIGACNFYLDPEQQKLYGFSKSRIEAAIEQKRVLESILRFIKQQQD